VVPVFCHQWIGHTAAIVDSGRKLCSDRRQDAIVLGPVKHKPLTRRPSALLDLPCARWL